MKRLSWAYCILFSLIFILSIGVNVRTSAHSYTQLYYPKEMESQLDKNTVYNLFSFINSFDIILSYTGLETGFGFFAPNVASEYLAEFKVYNSDSTLIHKSNFPVVQSRESLIRLSSAYQMFSIYSEDSTITDSFKLKKSNIFLKGLATKVLSETQNGSYVEAKTYLYHHPLLEQLKANPELKPITIENKTKLYTNEDTWKNYFK